MCLLEITIDVTLPRPSLTFSKAFKTMASFTLSSLLVISSTIKTLGFLMYALANAILYFWLSLSLSVLIT